MPAPGSSAASTRLTSQVREQFVAHAASVLSGMATAITERLVVMVGQAENTREAQARRDASQLFQKLNADWTRGTVTAWRKALTLPVESREPAESVTLELIGDDVVENKILASRLALAVMDKAGGELNDLRLRIQSLESSRELSAQDILRPEVVCLIIVEQWNQAGLTRFAWGLAQDVIQQYMVENLTEAFHHANEYLISQGVLPEIDLKSQIRRSTMVPLMRGDEDDDYEDDGGYGGEESGAGADRPRSASGSSSAGNTESRGGRSRTRSDSRQDSRADSRSASRADYDDQGTPMGRARQRAQGLLGQLKRVLGESRDPDAGRSRGAPSEALVRAINQAPIAMVPEGSTLNVQPGSATQPVADSARVAKVADGLRERTATLKNQAGNNSEKATIEIVALMFQSILAEERIPPAIRVWFARLQLPVMRVALFEPEFFSTLHHPARKLIDHMGSCVLGFDSRAITGSALEAEIRRIVQVIEQYPDTGRRVFQLVYDEFQKFLSKYLTEKGSSQRVATLAQQVEQKETLAIQYTIELRNMLNSMPVREEIRDFMFKVWAEVLAVAAIKNGAQHEETVMLKRSASDLVWAASAKPSRTERAQVIQDLPNLLQRLRQGMTLLGLTGAQQEAHIKVIGDTLADAFMSKTESIPQDRIDAMSERLAHLEDFIIQDGPGDIPLDAASIEMLVGIDASSIVVVADGGSKPSQAMLAWAQELQPGTWYTLDHNGKASQVQYVWRSDRKQLHLFASVDGRSYLIQARRLAAYLQAGLLVPQEEEALTVRATRTALEKIDANPERLLS